MAKTAKKNIAEEHIKVAEDIGLDLTKPSGTLNQNEIDELFGFSATASEQSNGTGVKALLNTALMRYERLPMLEIAFERLVRLATTSLRAFTSDNVEAALGEMSSVRFGDYLNSVPLPALLTVFKAEPWNNYGLLTIDSNLIYAMIDILMGGRRGANVARIEGRPYTSIEMSLAQRIIELVLSDMQTAFEPLGAVTFTLDRIETNPRFASVSRPTNGAIKAELAIDIDGRGGNIHIVLPYATIEPIRDKLMQMYMGEKFGRDAIWEGHLATEIHQAEVPVDVVLHEMPLALGKVMSFAQGETLMFDRKPTDTVLLRCGNVDLTRAVVGHIGKKVSVRVTQVTNPPKVTMADFNAIGASEEVEE